MSADRVFANELTRFLVPIRSIGFRFADMTVTEMNRWIGLMGRHRIRYMWRLTFEGWGKCHRAKYRRYYDLHLVAAHISDEDKDGCGACCYSRDYGGHAVPSQAPGRYACVCVAISRTVIADFDSDDFFRLLDYCLRLIDFDASKARRAYALPNCIPRQFTRLLSTFLKF